MHFQDPANLQKFINEQVETMKQKSQSQLDEMKIQLNSIIN